MLDPGVDIREARARDEDALTDLAFEYLDWAIKRLRSELSVEWPPITRDGVAESIDKYRDGGAVLLATDADEPVGMGAVRRIAPGISEIKRMYVRPRARGMRIGARILDELLARARANGATVVRLDTIAFMHEAQRLYRSRGFVERGPYEGSEIPVPFQPHWLFFELSLEEPRYSKK